MNHNNSSSSMHHIEHKTAGEPVSEDDQVLLLKSQLTATPPDWDAIKSTLDEWQPSSMMLSRTACELVHEHCFCEYRSAINPNLDAEGNPVNLHEEYRKVVAENLVSYYLPNIVKLFLDYRMNPNDIVSGHYGQLSIMMLLQYVDYKETAARCMRLLIEGGGNLDIEIDGESLFEEVDSDIVLSDYLLNTHEEYEIYLQHMMPIWLVLIGYGCCLRDGRLPVEMRNGYTQEQFKAFERFRWEVKWRKPTEVDNSRWYIHIYDKENGAEAAVF